MAILITRTAVVPVWLLACALVVVMAAPSAMVATGLLLLSSGLAAAAILLLGKNAVQSVSDGPPTIDVRPLRVTAVPRQLRPPVPRPEPSADRPLSWPNSGFRNIGRGTKGG